VKQFVQKILLKTEENVSRETFLSKNKQNLVKKRNNCFTWNN